MEVFSILLLANLGLLLIIWYYITQRSVEKHSPTILLFIDAPDPDNPAAALAVYKCYYKAMKGPLHIIITGRPINLRTPLTLNDSTSSIRRHPWEIYVPEHSRRLLQDSGSRISTYLAKCGIDIQRNIKIYNGDIAPCAPISDTVHDWDFLFDRKDLITGIRTDEGEVLSPIEYQMLVDKYSKMSDSEREKEFLSLLRTYKFYSLDDLHNTMANKSCTQVHVYLGGPATAMAQLFKGQFNLSCKIMKFYGMFGSLNPGSSTLLENQFNVACDLKSACQVFVDKGGMFPHVHKHLVTTETCKLKPLVLSYSQLQQSGAYSHVVELQKLWEYTHNSRTQPFFDVLPVMASLDKYRSCFSWYRKCADITKDEKIFYFRDSSDNGGTIILTCDYLSTREQYVEFLKKLWSK